MILGMMPGITKPLEVQAATTNVAPTPSQFAKRADLMTKYDLNDSTTGKTVQKVIFGQNGSGATQKWKIAGKDTGINGDNIVLFAAKRLGGEVQFDNNTQEGYKTYDNTKGCTYNPDLTITKINPNHYGCSKLRQTISGFLTSESYFTLAEQTLMNFTTITTYDKYNNTTYTTNDKLYAEYGDDDDDQYITVGTNSANLLNGGLRIDIGNWGDNIQYNSSLFWLRVPSADDALVAKPDNCVVGDNVDNFYNVLPAFDLNLSSVLFASAASAATSESITVGDAFTLRYEASTGSDMASASAVIGADYKTVAVSNVTNGMYLVVQNRAGAYAKALTSGTTSVSANDITGIDDFENCKVWLESTTNRITTAKMATQALGYNVDITAGSHMTRSSVTGNGTASQIVNQGSAMTSVVYTADDGYCFPTGYSVTSENGISVNRDSESQITVSGTPTVHTTITLTDAVAKTKGDTTTTSHPTCNHDYEWDVEKAPTETEDGEAVYKCTKCGTLSARQPLTAYQYYILTSTNKIKNAKAGQRSRYQVSIGIHFRSHFLNSLRRDAI